jgi:trehalose 6-phosphate phosphatase
MSVLMQESKVDHSVEPRVQAFLKTVQQADRSALLLDFDGTLAPFRIDPSMVQPWSGVARLLDQIQEQGSTRIAIVTGRPTQDVATQLGVRFRPEIWGLHGAERLLPDGQIERQPLSASETRALTMARQAVEETGILAEFSLRFEDKPNAVVVHWRGHSPQSIRVIQFRLTALLNPFAGKTGLKLLQFDGGIELRAGRNKGDAVRTLLDDIPHGAPVAYLGDDITDEDAFTALEGRGLGVMVRREWRPTAAQVWLRPPVALRRFLRDWLCAVQS